MPSPDYLPGAKYGIRAIAGDTNISDIDAWSQALVADIESKMAGYVSGTSAARLAATARDGLVWHETDTGYQYLGNGASWTRVGIGSPPIGSILPYAGSGDPPLGEWVIADGRLIDKTTYAAFFTAVGHAYNLGVDPGANKVKIPDKRGKKSVGAIDMGSAAGAGANDTSHSQVARGASGGSTTHSHTVPGLSVPSLSVPSLSIPSLSVAGHAHGLDNEGGAMVGISESSGVGSVHFTSNNIGFPTIGDGPNFEALRIGALAGGLANTDHTATSVPLVGTTQSGGSSTGTGSTGTGSSGTGTTGTGTSGATATADPYEADSYLVRIA